jgi:type IV secretory pathway VirB2 component (pilin)
MNRAPTSKPRILLFTWLVYLLSGPSVAHAFTGLGGGMPWETPLDQLVSSLTGPVAKAIGIVSIVGVGFAMAFSDGGTVLRRALWVVLGLSLAFNAASWGLQFLGFGGGALL